MNICVILTLVVLFVSQQAFSQGFKVKEFKQNINDGSAFNSPMDTNGHPCGLIKVRTGLAELQFRGDIIGNVENKTNEYWVFMAKGSKQLGILHPNFLPMSVDFGTYGINEIDSKATYVMTLTETKNKKEKTGVTIVVKPEDAELMIASKIVENLSGHGFYQLYLPKGEYICILSKEGYRPNSLIVKTGKTSQNINVELESLMAELEVKCKTETAEIFIDGELKGNGTWKGYVFAGNHIIEARQQNFVSSTQTVTIAEKESRSFIIPQLKRAKGKVRIETIPSGLPIRIDNEDAGMSPCVIDLDTGAHYVTSEFYGLKPCRKEFEVRNDGIQIVSLKMEYSMLNSYSDRYEKAYNGDQKSIEFLANKTDDAEALYWYDKCLHPENLFADEYWEMDVFAPHQTQWIFRFCDCGKPEKALEAFSFYKKACERNHYNDRAYFYLRRIGESFLNNNNIDKAIMYFTDAVVSSPSDDLVEYWQALEGLGDCYRAKGNKQLAINYYRKYLNTIDRMHPNWRNDSMYYSRYIEKVEKKLKELGYN